MAWTYRAAGTAANGNNATSLNPGLPTGWQPGDLCIVQFQNFGVSGARTPSISEGWTGVANVNGYFSSGNTHHGTWYRILQSGDTAPTITLSGGGGANDTQLSRTFCFYPGAGKLASLKTANTGSTNASADNVGPIAGLTGIATGDLLILSCGKGNDWNGTPTLTGWDLATSLTESTTGSDAGMALLYDTGVSGTIADVTVTDSGGTASNGVGCGVMFAFAEVDYVAVDKGDLVLTGSTDLKADISEKLTAGSIAFTGTTLGTSQSFGTGSLVFTGQDVTLTAVESGYTILVDHGSLAFAGQDSSLGTKVAVDKADITLFGQSVTGNIGIVVTKADAVLTGSDILTKLDVKVDPSTIAFAGSNVLLLTENSITVDAGTLTFSGTVVGTSQSFGIGQLAFSGQDVTLLSGEAFTLPVDFAALTFTPQDIILQGPAQGETITVDAGQLTFTGTTLGTSQSFGAGQLAFTGSEVGYVWASGVTVEPALLTFAGQEVGLTAPSGTSFITVESGNLDFTGSVVDLEEAVLLDSGLLTFTGSEILWQPGTIVEGASLSFVGSNVDLLYIDAYVLPVDSGSLNFIPGDVGYVSTDAYLLQVEPGIFSFSGANPPSMGLGVAVEENTDFEFTGQEVLFVHQRDALVEPASLNFSGSELGYRLEGAHTITVQPAALVFTGGSANFVIGIGTNEGRIDGSDSYTIDQSKGSVLLYPKDRGYYVISKSAA